MSPTTSCISTILSLLFTITLTLSHKITPQTSPRDFLNPHNSARVSVGVRQIQWSDTLAAYTEDYAYSRADDCRLVHSDGPYGENLFWGSDSGFTAADAVEAWVGEREWYDYGRNLCLDGEECGHYTQVVWAETVRDGCGSVACRGGRGVFMVCSYWPAGNVIAERPY